MLADATLSSKPLTAMTFRFGECSHRYLTLTPALSLLRGWLMCFCSIHVGTALPLCVRRTENTGLHAMQSRQQRCCNGAGTTSSVTVMVMAMNCICRA